MILGRLVILLACAIVLSISTSFIVEFFSCPTYNPNLWNHDKVQTYNNCYVYALNRPETRRTKKTSPGLGEKGAGDKGIGDYGRDYSNYTCSYFDELIKHDIPNAIKMDVKDAKELSGKCPESYHEIALVLDDNFTPDKKDEDDFHFYRRDCGTKFWSHKPGSAPVTKLDASGKYITDPQYSDRNFSNHNYYKFCGYYCIPNQENEIYELTKKELGL
jgi:hypothetical protein